MESNQLPFAYQATAHPYELHRHVVARGGVEPPQDSFGGHQPHSLGRAEWVRRLESNQRHYGVKARAGYRQPTPEYLVLRYGVEPYRPRQSAQSPQLIRPRRSPELRSKLVSSTRVERACFQLTFQLVRSQRVYEEVGGSPRTCALLVRVKAGYVAIYVCDPNWSHAVDVRHPSFAYEAIASLPMLARRIGAQLVNRTPFSRIQAGTSASNVCRAEWITDYDSNVGHRCQRARYCRCTIGEWRVPKESDLAQRIWSSLCCPELHPETAES